MKAKGSDIWDFYLNGYPMDYAHDDWNIQVAYWPSTADDSTGAYSLLDDEKEYDLSVFGTFYHEGGTELSFEDAYLKWKGIEKPEPMTFEEWFNNNFVGNDEATKILCEKVWNATIASVQES